MTGCGGSDQVTYVDPNVGDPATTGGELSGEPIRRFGAAAAERAKAIVRIRASLAAARTLAATDRAAARDVIARSIEEDLPVVEPRIHAARPDAATALREGLESLRDAPPRNVVAYTREVRRLGDSLLVQAADIVVPMAARQDQSFQAAILYETLQHAGIAYEAAFDGSGEQVEHPDEYRLAYGLLIDASTRQLDAVPEDARPRIRSQLDKVARSSLPGPTPPEQPRDPVTVLGELSSLGDEVAQAAAIDPTWPAPDPATPDQLRSLKRSVAAAVEAFERGDVAAARRQLQIADRTHLALASGGLAAVSPGLLAELERDLVFALPEAMAAGSDVTAAAAEVDARIDQAIQLVEEELELLREAD